MRHFAGPDGPMTVPVSGAFSANNSEAVHRAAVGGAGIAMLPHSHVFDDLRTGRLYNIPRDYILDPQPVYMVYRSRRHLASRTRVVIDFLAQEIQTALAALARRAALADMDNPWLV